MSGPGAGNYSIETVGEAMLKIGAAIKDSGPTVPVALFGKDDVFRLTPVDGKCVLTTGNLGQWNVKIDPEDPEKKRVVASLDGPPAIWNISGPEEGPYVIRPTRIPIGVDQCWTLDEDKVVIGTFPIDYPDRFKWAFNRVVE